MQKYLVKYSADYIDEFDVYGLSLLTQEDKDYFDNLSEDIFPLTHRFGSNDGIEFSSKEQLLDCYDWFTLTESEYETLARLIGTDYGALFYPECLDDEEEI